ncbi:TAP-like protein-domain-containing protein [Leucosporidium creatinivorum]|uniref:TAP-like protein-domain-containing protein n=1 Tax=Leucosporidium creatinivorum TaxID=106004 RepID=A0A1Y2G3A0_9BASI|nr:TAP-like protein-domain-containing protein [Leucosporidium creatinivorum]
MEKHQLPLTLPPTPAKQRPSPTTYIILLLSLLALSAQFAPRLPFSACSHSQAPNDTLHWTPCGDGLQCSKLAVPLNWDNRTDEREVVLSILKRPGSRQKDKLGSLYINPGGPGGAGSYIETAGWFFDKLLDGRYDLIIWDPRGVNRTSDHITCFSSSLTQHLYALTTPTSLSTPSNFSSPTAEGLSDPHAIFQDLENQIRLSETSLKALYQRCWERTGETLAFVGTKSVVRDLEAISRAVEGGEGRINFWGMSYGTIIAQYLTSLLPPHRLGKIVMDGVVNATMWTGPWDHFHPYSSLRDIQPIYSSFATSCLAAGDRCALSSSSNFSSPEDLLDTLSALLDSVYHDPVPLPQLENAPALVAQAKHLKMAMFRAAYSVKEWPSLARKLERALKGDWSELVEGTLPVLEGGWEGAGKRPDPSSLATTAIRCADASPHLTHPTHPPTPHSLASDVALSLTLNSPFAGDQLFDLSFCHLWPVESRSYYDYVGAEEEQKKLDTPVLVLNQRFDPVTPLGAAERVLQRLGGSARLVVQEGAGHCVIGQASLCTAKIIRSYLLSGELPSSSHTSCEVDELPFGAEAEDDEEQGVGAGSSEERELLRVWRGAEGLVQRW